MKIVTAVVVTIFALTATGSIYAQGRGQGQAKKTSVSAPKAPKIKTETPKHTTTQTTKTETRTAKTEARAAKTAAKAETRATKAETKAARKTGTTTTTTTTATTVEVTPTTPTTQHVKNPKLEERLLKLLPPGSTIQEASAGFKNWGQFVAATHVSTNLGIPFANLKTAMTGIQPGATIPTAAPMSLGQAIQSWKGTTPVTTPLSSTQINNEVKKAEDAANADLRRTRERS